MIDEVRYLWWRTIGKRWRYLLRPVTCGTCGGRIWTSDEHRAWGVRGDWHFGCTP